MVQALVPLKDLVEAKSRLAGLLRPSERRALVQAMAEDVLGVLARHSQVSHITLVSDDPGADLLAARYGAICWPEKALGCHGLNAVIACASARLLAASQEPLLVLHADLPLLAEADIDAVLDSQRESGGLIIGCDGEEVGTNLLAFDADSMPTFCFGDNSCAKHRETARHAGIPVTVLQLAGIACDVDEPVDLQYLLRRLPSRPDSKTAALLSGSALGRRVAVATASLGNSPYPVKQQGMEG